jgi:hypothetical protein
MIPKLSSNQTKHAQSLLRKIRFAREDGKKKRLDYLARLYLKSFDAKLVAVRRAAELLISNAYVSEAPRCAASNQPADGTQ